MISLAIAVHDVYMQLIVRNMCVPCCCKVASYTAKLCEESFCVLYTTNVYS